MCLFNKNFTAQKDFFFQICQPNFLQKILPSICFYISNTRACALILFKIYFPLIVLIFGQKSCFLGPTIFDIPQPNRYILVCSNKFRSKYSIVLVIYLLRNIMEQTLQYKNNTHYLVISLQLTNEEEKLAFIDDYRITACISILQWFVMEYKKYGASGVESYDAKARRSVVEFSLQRCKVKRHKLNAR